MTKKPTEYEKMLAAEPYFGLDAEIMALAAQGRANMKAYQVIPEEDEAARQVALGKIFGSGGENVKIVEPFYIDYGCHVHLGSGFINMGCTFLDGNKINIGDMTLVGPHVQFLATSHPAHPDERISERLIGYFMGENDASDIGMNISKPIVVGEKCWIGGGAIIMGGVTIGDGTTIGAGSVVTKDIPARCVAVGSPARVIRYFDEDDGNSK
ncbi:MAG: maltose acetyltransferase [Hyphomicrobiales bacterium]|nr:MAG: maltose acetyltransferase [Hyphomicrobiales bacterium]